MSEISSRIAEKRLSEEFRARINGVKIKIIVKKALKYFTIEIIPTQIVCGIELVKFPKLPKTRRFSVSGNKATLARNEEDAKARMVLNINNGLRNVSERLEIESSENFSLYSKDFKK